MGPVETLKGNGILASGDKMKNSLCVSGRVRFILTDVKTGAVDVGPWVKNIVPLSGRTAIARRLVNAAALENEGMITYGAVGTGITVPTNSDTTLGTELARKLAATRTNTDNKITIWIFFTTAEANGSLKEFGLFGEAASATADSGTLFQRVLIDKVKDNTKTLTVESIVEIT